MAGGGGEILLEIEVEGAAPREDAGRVQLGGDLLLRDLHVLDAGGVELPSWFETDVDRLWIVADASAARWPVTVDPLLTTTWIVDPPDQVDAEFGKSVAGAGDIDADGFADLLVSAPAWGNGASIGEGRVWMYRGGAGGPPLSPTWTANATGQASAAFGYGLDGIGDVNGDGFADVGVGAPSWDGQASDEGRVYVYHGSAAALPGSANWTADPTNEASAWFGRSVTGGDVNGDGFADLIVGAPLWDGGAFDRGKVYAFHGSAGGLAASPTWETPAGPATFRLGVSVAVADVNGDGCGDLVAGAPDYDSAIQNEGAVYLFLGGTTGLGSTSTAYEPADQSYAQFGWSVSSAGDVNDDGWEDVIVGAPGWDGQATDEGRAYLYLGAEGTLSATHAQALDPADQAWAEIGKSVADAGDVNGDGFADVAIGAPGAGTGGKAYVFAGTKTGVASSPLWQDSPTAQAWSEFGRAVSSSGDVNGDGLADVVVAAPRWDSASYANEGRAYWYKGGWAVCGDGLCEANESACSCAADCGNETCGNGVCCAPGETTATCAADCKFCGDGVCTAALGETTCQCSQDCGASCGDGCCNGAESSSTCPADCGLCGDGRCAPSENATSCPEDCDSPCGNGTCGTGETCADCPRDCGAVCGDGCCGPREVASNCAADCPAVCGDDVCTGSEHSDPDNPTDAYCPMDCGALAMPGVLGTIPTTTVKITASADANADGLPESLTLVGGTCGSAQQFTLSPGTSTDACGIQIVLGTGGDDSKAVATGFSGVLYGGPGHDLLFASDKGCLIYGGAGNDRLIGGPMADRLSGDAGADSIFGAAGDDLAFGGIDNDVLHGAPGKDELLAGDGEDFIRGGPGDDALFGGLGDDRILGEGGNDLIRASNGSDTAIGGSGDDTIFTESGDDKVYGEGGNDCLDGGTGHDVIRGKAGNDKIQGGYGDDYIRGDESGSNGDDWIVGGCGEDDIDARGGDDHIDAREEFCLPQAMTNLVAIYCMLEGSCTTVADNDQSVIAGDGTADETFVDEADPIARDNEGPCAKNDDNACRREPADPFPTCECATDGDCHESPNDRLCTTDRCARVSGGGVPWLFCHVGDCTCTHTSYVNAPATTYLPATGPPLIGTNETFVDKRVVGGDPQFHIAGSPYNFVGVNAYYLPKVGYYAACQEVFENSEGRLICSSGCTGGSGCQPSGCGSDSCGPGTAEPTPGCARCRIDQVFSELAAMGVKVIRLWAHKDEDYGDLAIQRREPRCPGDLDLDCYDGSDACSVCKLDLNSPLDRDSALRGLDYVLWRARVHDLKVIMTLTDYQGADASVKQYLRWNGCPREGELADEDLGYFFKSARIKAHFKAYIKNLVWRRNRFVCMDGVVRSTPCRTDATCDVANPPGDCGRLYRDDKTIMAWELINEPRGKGLAWHGQDMRDWIDEVAGYLDSIDGRHLISIGEEGFEPEKRDTGSGEFDRQATSCGGAIGPGGTYPTIDGMGELAPDVDALDKALYSSGDGSSFCHNIRSPYIDFATIHYWPENWGVCRDAAGTSSKASALGDAFIADHQAIATASTVDKPLVVEEIGLRNDAVIGSSSPPWCQMADLDCDVGAGSGNRCFPRAERRSVIDRWFQTTCTNAVDGMMLWNYFYDNNDGTEGADLSGDGAWAWNCCSGSFGDCQTLSPPPGCGETSSTLRYADIVDCQAAKFAAEPPTCGPCP